jgi:hypothetical protein
MATLQQKIAAEHKMRELLESEGLPEPSRIEYGHTCIRVFWEESKLVLAIDIDEPPEDFERIGEEIGDINELSDHLKRAD